MRNHVDISLNNKDGYLKNKMKSRVDIHKYGYGVYITSPPYKSFKYFLIFILYLITLSLFVLSIIYRNEIFFNSGFTAILQSIIFLFVGGLLLLFALNGLPLFFYIIKNSLIRNLFLEEYLRIERGSIEYTNNLGKQINCKLSQIKWIYFEFNKPSIVFDGVERIIPNFTPTIYLRDLNDQIFAKIMHSIKEDEIQNIYEVITNLLIEEKYFYQEYDVNYTDKIKDVLHFGKEIKFISARKYFEIHRGMFSREELAYFDKLQDQHISIEDVLSNALLSKIKDDQSNERPKSGSSI